MGNGEWGCPTHRKRLQGELTYFLVSPPTILWGPYYSKGHLSPSAVESFWNMDASIQPHRPLPLLWQRGRAMVGLELQVGFTLQDKQFIGISNWLGGGYGIERISAARVGQLYIKGYRSHFIHIPCP